MSENIFQTNITVTEFDEIALEEGCTPLTKIHKYTLSNGFMEVDILDYGAIVQAIRVPDRDGRLADIVLGYDNMEGYLATKNNPYFGATVGRFANRIANGKFTLDKLTYILSRNEGENTLHGGVIGFNRRLWKGCVDLEGLSLHLTSPHLDEGFPGELTIKARFILTRHNHLLVRYTAGTDRPTIINMTSHSYFNLAGHDAGAEKLYEHSLMINANNFTPNDDNNIPKGKIKDVLDTVLDFTTPKNMGEAIEKTEEANGFDINFCVNGIAEKRLVACLEHPGTGRRMIVESNQPGVQLYTGNCVEVKEGKGKGGAGYSRHAGLCLETQNYPNAINEKHFPSCILRPPDIYTHIVCYQFSTFDEVVPVKDDENTLRSKSIGDSAGEDLEENFQQERSLSIKSEKKECTKSADPKSDALECLHKDMFPDFTIGPKCPDLSLEYEPMSSIFPNEADKKKMISFQTELKHCREIIGLIRGNEFRILNTKSLKNPKYNIVADTNISPTWPQTDE